MKSSDAKRAKALARAKFAGSSRKERLSRLAETRMGRKLAYKRQFEMSGRGDVARRLHLLEHLDDQGGWHSRQHHGLVSGLFLDFHFGNWYAGPSHYPSYCWTPHWSPWVSWCWWDHCGPMYDPRPIFCRPLICQPCSPWVQYSYPVWISLPVVTSGTWVDVDPLVVDGDLDLQLLAVRFVDAGHPEKKLGPRYRVWIRNNSPKTIRKDFNVVLLAGNTPDPRDGYVEAGITVDKIEAGQLQTVDIRLPFEANRLARDKQGRAVPFEFLHVLVDAHQEIPEAFEANNGVVLARGDVLPIDPSTFSANVSSAEPGDMISIAGEGLGPEPGEAIVYINKLELQAEIHGWYDLGVRIRLPRLPLAAATEAQIVIVRGDGAVSNPVSITLVPGKRNPIPPAAPKE